MVLCAGPDHIIPCSPYSSPSPARFSIPHNALPSNQEPSDLLKLNSAEERDTYEVYSAVLRDRKPSVETWKILHETRPFAFCLKHPASMYVAVLDDYTMKNRDKLILNGSLI
jgi:hypothetical protein